MTYKTETFGTGMLPLECRILAGSKDKTPERKRKFILILLFVDCALASFTIAGSCGKAFRPRIEPTTGHQVGPQSGYSAILSASFYLSGISEHTPDSILVYRARHIFLLGPILLRRARS